MRDFECAFPYPAAVEFQFLRILYVYSTTSLLPFRSYRVPHAEDGFDREIEFPSSVTHFFQSERFRGVNERLRIETLAQPTAREARKFACRHARFQRDDWDKKGKLVMCCGLWLQAIEYPYIAGLIASGQYQFGGLDEYWAPRHGEGAFPKALKYLANRLRSPVRVFLYGVGFKISSFQFDANLVKLFRRNRPDEIVIGRTGEFADVAEKWAISRAVAVRRGHVFSRLHRASDASMRESISGATHAVIFGERQASGRLVSMANSMGIATRLISPKVAAVSGQSPPAVRGRDNIMELHRA